MRESPSGPQRRRCNATALILSSLHICPGSVQCGTAKAVPRRAGSVSLLLSDVHRSSSGKEVRTVLWHCAFLVDIVHDGVRFIKHKMLQPPKVVVQVAA
jgi:hypothetical protein